MGVEGPLAISSALRDSGRALLKDEWGQEAGM